MEKNFSKMDLTNILAKNKSGDCSGGMYTVLPKTEKRLFLLVLKFKVLQNYHVLIQI